MKFGANTSFSERLQRYPGCRSVSPTDETELAEAIREMRRNRDGASVYALFSELFTRSGNVARYVEAVRFEEPGSDR